MSDKSNYNMNLKTFIPVLVIIFFAVFSAFSLILLLITKNILIDSKDINLLDMCIRSAFVLLGSTLSGCVAIFIFSLQERSKKIEKDEKELGYYKNIKGELSSNYKVIEKITKLINDSSIEDLAKQIHTTKEVKELILVIFTQLNFSYYDSLVKEINKTEFNNCKEAAHLSHQIYKYLDVIINKLDDEDNIATILRLIKNDILELKEVFQQLKKE